MFNTGGGLIMMVICADTPHCPPVGVNVYSVLPTFAVLIEEGFQVPSIPSFDFVGRAGAISFWQYESAIVGKVGVMVVAMVIFIEAGIAQLPADDGVN